MSGQSCDKTYRVCGLSSKYTEEQCEKVLSLIFQNENQNENLHPKVHSLGLDPYPGSCVSQTATVTFANLPKAITNGTRAFGDPQSIASQGESVITIDS